MKTKPSLEDEYHWYLANQVELVKQYDRKYLAIKQMKVLGAFLTLKDAFDSTKVNHKPGTFLIQFCVSGREIVYHSRVSYK